ncbi:cell division protein ZipA [Zhengella mangrovi]|uniref:Cell division protein ZipA n=2 Tax=Zhengella mangrovi TaxID=1982044 RepID=A0A2G1QPJ7_9HYPH|nr:ATP-binding protein [Zhengella mangrovi]PHP67432.1 cell division protein ZipA [Zhengella mangrovi]
MSQSSPTLHMLCGKIAAGKSTLASRLAGSERTVLIAEDDWLDALFSDQMATIADYVRCSGKLRAVMGPHVSALLEAGTSVVLDFPANTVGNRDWMRGILEASGAAHQLHVLTVPDEVCLARLARRNAGGDHPFAVTEEQFHRMSRYYVEPTAGEGFNIVSHGNPG